MTQFSEEQSSKYANVKEGSYAFKVHYNDFGSGEVVLMLHGAGAGASGWSNFHRNVEPFVNAGYRVILMDAPGWNKSDPVVVSEGYRSDLNAAAVKGLLDVLQIDKVNLIGNSMGGITSLAFALKYPERLNKMVIMGGGGLGQSLFVPMPTEGIKLLAGVYRNPTAENLKRMLDIFVYDNSTITPELLEGRLKNILDRKIHIENFVQSQAVNPHQFPDFSSQLSKIKAKTLITWGRDDRFIALDAGLRLVWGLPNADLHIFSQCGHWAQWEHADKFNSLTLNFVQS